MKFVLLIAGLVALAFGLIWVGQGLGYITWHPAGMAPSFMVGDRNWVYYGAALAVFGVFLIIRSRR